MSLKSRATAVLGLATLAFCALTPVALADSGALDTGYGTGGTSVVPALAGAVVTDSVAVPGGGVAVTGTVGTAPNRDIFVAKFTSAGTLDTSFAGTGYLTQDVSGDDLAEGITIRPGGGFVVGGGQDQDTPAPLGFVLKTDTAGALDASWGPGGIALSSDDHVSIISRAFELAGGDVIFNSIAAIDIAYQRAVMDATGTIGASSQDYPFPSNGNLDDVRSVQQSNGNITSVTLTSDSGNANSLIAQVTTFNPTTMDPSVAQQAISVPAGTQMTGAFVTSGDKVLVTGSTMFGSTKRGAIWRFNADGTLDSTFGTAGVLSLPTSTDDFVASGLATDSKGTFYVAGDLGTDRVRTLHLKSDFSLDTAFGEGGIADRSYGTGATRVSGVLVDASDRPVETGTIGGAAASWRVERFDYANFALGAVTYSPSFVQRLNTVSFSYSIKNNGPDASDVSLDVDVPASFESQAFSTTFGSVTPAADKSGGTWNIPQLAAGSTATLTLTGKPGDIGTLTSKVTFVNQSAQPTAAVPTSSSVSVTVYGAATPRDDVITGTPRKDIIDALSGNDIVHALAGNDIVLGDLGNDTLFGELGDDTLSGGEGNDRAYGGAGNDKVSGDAGTDVVDGGTGNDKVAGGSGNDLLYGRSGNDRLDGGTGNDKVFAGTGNDKVLGGLGADKLYGEGGNDYLIAQGNGDKLYGGPGRDRVDGGAGTDMLFGGTGNDWINGKSGNDHIDGGAGNDWLRGMGGNDIIIGGRGDDLLNGGAGKDRLNAGSGDDIIRADDGFGGDVINCGSGWDLVYANPGDRVASNCEYVKYDVPAGTRYHGDRGADAPTRYAAAEQRRHHG